MTKVQVVVSPEARAALGDLTPAKVTEAWNSGYQASGFEREAVEKFDEEIEAHLVRYIVNRNKRTGKVWEVVKRYTTLTLPERYFWKYMRAVVSDGEVNVRIYYRGSYWRQSA